MKFKTFGWLLTAIIGLGSATPQHRITEYATLDGGNDEGTRKPTRQFTLVGQFAANSYGRLRDNRAALAALLDRDLIGADQRLKLRYQAMRGCDLVGEEAEVICKYQGGLEGETNGHFGSTAPITFTQYLPVVLGEGEIGAALAVQTSVANANAILKRSPAGVWAALSTGVSGGSADVYALTVLPDGRIVVAGDYTDAGGSGADFAALYTPSTDAFAVMVSATSFNNPVFDTALTPAGNVVLVGLFTNVGSASGDAIVQYNVAANTFSALGTGANGQLNAVAVASNGYIFAGGANTTDLGGVANTNGIGYWDGAAWNAMGFGLDNGSVVDIFADGDDVYVMGSFTSVNIAQPNTGFAARWNITSAAWFSVTGILPNDTVWSGVRGPNGVIYFAGTFTTFGGVSANYHAKWNKVTPAPVMAATTLTGLVELRTQIFDAAGLLHFGGSPSGASLIVDGVAYPDTFARYNGSSYIPQDVDLPGAPVIRTLALSPDGTLYVGFTTTGTAIAAAITTITNIGTAKAYPTLIIKGPSSGTSRIYQIVNYTTNRSIYLNLTINAGETAILRFEPDNLSFTSDFQGNITNTILSGSNEADFFLQPGANSVSFFAADSTVTATLQWRPAYLSLDDR